MVMPLQEKLDLKALVGVAVVEESRLRELNLPISESRVSALIRSPCVAIRYITAESKVRKRRSDHVGSTLIAIPSCVGPAFSVEVSLSSGV